MRNLTQSSWTLTNFARVDFRPDEFDRAIYQKGARILWEKAILCSCINDFSGQPDFNCPSCKGKTFSYFDPIETRGIVTGISGDNNNIPIGLIDLGTAYLSTNSNDKVSFRDRITFLDMTTAYSQVLKYTNDPIEMKYKAKEILSVRVLDSEIPETEYELSVDKTKIIFKPDTLQEDEQFSILIIINPVYVVIDMPHDLRGTFVKFGNAEETWVNLPKQLIIKREDLLPLKRGEL